MASIEQTFEQACASGDYPGAVLLATNADGSFRYEKAIGKRSLHPGSDKQPLDLHTVMWIASCTKLLGTIAALQCVDRGQLSLDAPVYNILPEFKDQDIITGFENGKPQFRKHTKPMTLRHLLTHSSGLSYEFFQPLLIKWRNSRGEPFMPGSTVEERMNIPLLYEPGTEWKYSCGIDWAGKMVERVTKMPLDAYMQKHMFAPLGIKDMTFKLDERPDLQARMADMIERDEQTGKLRPGSLPELTQNTKDSFAGQGIYASWPEYLKVLQSLLANDGKLLKPATVDSMFEPQLYPSSHTSLNTRLDNDEPQNVVSGNFPRGTNRDWGFGGVIKLEEQQDWRKSNVLTWSGLPNQTWWIDREADVCGICGPMMLPLGDKTAQDLTQFFKLEITKLARAA
ncbi:beta-lactamase/transpeptidase-like protein [Phyllosticta citribraziliensis]|uniref:Beta-lactamase/transpeptidase-like protein n=1 Tax=Phyllosticta citribraziliensis TaxID=989973 RepID=A0ABR1M131_9PEZI